MVLEAKKRRGRPPGSKNKVKTLTKLKEWTITTTDKPKPVLPTGKGRLIGHNLELANECGNCGGRLEASDSHFHTRRALDYYGAEPICCKCGGHEYLR